MQHPVPTAEQLPADLVERQQWVCWHLVDRGADSYAKPPINPRTGRLADVSDPSTWADFGSATRAALENGWGIGFVFTADDPYVGIDLDDCLEPSSRLLEGWAHEILQRFDTYAEASPSGTGIHVIARGTLGSGRKISVNGGTVELYDRAHYFTMSGDRLADSPPAIVDSQAVIEELLAQFTTQQPRQAHTTVDAQQLPDMPVVADEEVLRIALSARNSAKFQQLWDGNLTPYDGDDSRADLALCRHLAYWSCLNAEQIDRLFRQSKLYREKWERDDYRERTIQLAIDLATPDVVKVIERGESSRKRPPRGRKPRRPRNRRRR